MVSQKMVERGRILFRMAMIFENVHMIYESGLSGHVYALRGVTAFFPAGSWTAVVGSNGSGKSTMAKAAAGLGTVSSGRIMKEDGVLTYIVLQNPDSQLIGETVLEEVSLCLAADGSIAGKVQLVRELLEQVGLHVPLDTLVTTLSGGQKQLLNLASCLAAGANFIILDEITSMLDPASRALVLEAVQRIHRSGTAILWITHRPEELGFADRVLAMEAGQVVYDGESRHFFYPQDGEEGSPCERLGMELPYTVRVVRQLERKGYSIPERPVHARELKEVVRALCLS